MTEKELQAFADLVSRLPSDELDSVATIIFQELRLRAAAQMVQRGQACGH